MTIDRIFYLKKKILMEICPTLHFVKISKFHNCIKNPLQELKFCSLIIDESLTESPWRFLFTNKRYYERHTIIPSVLRGKIAISLRETRFSQ